MIGILRVVFGLPLAIGGVYLWVARSRNIKEWWVTGYVLYSLTYLAIFHLWLRAI